MTDPKEQLNDTFDEFSDLLLKQLKEAREGKRELKASDLEVIRKFLSDNNISAVGRGSKPASIAEHLPFTLHEANG